jgi:hypothetical protein
LRSQTEGGLLLGYVEGHTIMAVTVPQPSSGVEARLVECANCGQAVRVWVASPRRASLRRFAALLVAAVIGPLVVVPLFVVPKINELCVRAGGGPYTAGLIALGLFLLIALILLVVCLRSPLATHAVKARDFKHTILPE